MKMKIKSVASIFLITSFSACVGSSSNSSLALRSSELNSNEKLLPEVTVSNLEGDVFTLPRDLSANYSIIAFGFAHEQQPAIDTWAAELKQLEKNNSSLKFYEIPVIDSSNAALRTVIRNGMRTGISDEADRKRTMTLFVDKPAFVQALGVKDQGEIALMLVDRNGKVLWETSGVRSEEKSKALQTILDDTIGAKL